MIIAHLTTVDPEGAGELIQGVDFHKQKFLTGIDCALYRTVTQSCNVFSKECIS